MGMESHLDKGHEDMSKAKGQITVCGGILQFPSDSLSLWNDHHPVDKCENTLSDDVTECLGGVSCVQEQEMNLMWRVFIGLNG